MPVTIQPNITVASGAHYLPGSEKGTGNALFYLPISWRVGNPVNGFIVQHVQRNEKYWSEGIGVRRGSFYQVVNPFSYWEAWEVVAGAAGTCTITPSDTLDGAPVHDIFAVYQESRIRPKGKEPSEMVIYPTKKGTRGRWKIRGTVYFVPTAGFDRGGWHRATNPDTRVATNDRQAVDNAGRLLSRYDAPVRGDGLSLTGVLGNTLCTREFAGKWDWTRKVADDGVEATSGVKTRNWKYAPPTSELRSYPWGGNFDTAAVLNPASDAAWKPAMGAA